MARVIVIATLRGEIVEMNDVTGGRNQEVDVIASMELVERIDSEAVTMGYGSENRLRVALIFDRGFFMFKKQLEEQDWQCITLDILEPHHLNPPQRRGRPPKGHVAPEPRKFFSSDEVEYNRAVAAIRWVNEWSVGALKRARLFQRVVDLSTAHLINDFFSISAALVNFTIKRELE